MFTRIAAGAFGPRLRRYALLGYALLGCMLIGASPASAQDAKAEWWSNLEACDEDNRAACDRAVELAAQLFERTDRDVATTWLKVCNAGDSDRCEIGYRRFRATKFEDDEHPISHMFARLSCFGGMADLCRPWEEFETADEGKRAIVMAETCMQGAMPGTCNRALAYFRNQEGLYDAVTGDLARALCERYKSGSACRVWGEVMEATWDYQRAFLAHQYSCRQGLQASCPDAARLKKRVDYQKRKRAEAMDAEMRRTAMARQTTTYRAQLSTQGYTSPGRVRTPITPFGSSTREIANWNRYQKNLCLGSSVARRC